MDDTVRKKVEALTRDLTKVLPTLPDFDRKFFWETFRRHSSSARLDGHHSVRSVLDVGGSSCQKTDLLVLSGRDRTDRSGKAVPPIHQLLCGVIAEGLPTGQVEA